MKTRRTFVALAAVLAGMAGAVPAWALDPVSSVPAARRVDAARVAMKTMYALTDAADYLVGLGGMDRATVNAGVCAGGGMRYTQLDGASISAATALPDSGALATGFWPACHTSAYAPQWGALGGLRAPAFAYQFTQIRPPEPYYPPSEATHVFNAHVDAPDFWVGWPYGRISAGTGTGNMSADLPSEEVRLAGSLDLSKTARFTGAFSGGVDTLVTVVPGTDVWDQRSSLRATLTAGTVQRRQTWGPSSSSSNLGFTANLSMSIGGYPVTFQGTGTRNGSPFGVNEGSFALRTGDQTVATVLIARDASGLGILTTVVVDGISYPIEPR